VNLGRCRDQCVALRARVGGAWCRHPLRETARSIGTIRSPKATRTVSENQERSRLATAPSPEKPLSARFLGFRHSLTTLLSRRWLTGPDPAARGAQAPHRTQWSRLPWPDGLPIGPEAHRPLTITPKPSSRWSRATQADPILDTITLDRARGFQWHPALGKAAPLRRYPRGPSNSDPDIGRDLGGCSPIRSVSPIVNRFRTARMVAQHKV
jgi:hypothetical protein